MKVVKIKDCVIAILGGLSGFFIIGSFGAYETEHIETAQFIHQIVIGFLLAAVLILYIKYQIAKEEKAELLEEIEEAKADPVKLVESVERGAKEFELYK